jgi:hypothetical protein
VNFPETNLSFNTSVPDQTTCIAEPDPTYGGGGGGSGYNGCEPPDGGCGDGTWNPSLCECQDNGESSPIVIDTNGTGFSTNFCRRRRLV